MALERSRNQQDAGLNPATFALPSALSTSTTSAAIDLGSDTFKPEQIEVELSVPALPSAVVPSAATGGVTYLFESSTTSTFAAIARTIVSQNIAGSGSGVPATVLRTRVPSDCERYIRAKITFAATTASGATYSGTVSLRL